MDDRFRFRRLPSVARSVSSIDPEKDVRVRLLGSIIDSGNSSIVLDDGSGKAEIILDAPLGVRGVVRVFARVLPLEGGFELRAEIVQDMNGLDLNLYRRLYNTQNNIGQVF